MQYRTSISTAPPLDSGMRERAMGAMTGRPLPGVNADVYAARGQQNAVAYDRAAQQANADYVTKAKQLQAQMAMRGLEQLVQQRQYQNQASEQIMRQSGMLNGLLGGLFR
jgi:hypothetical protein